MGAGERVLREQQWWWWWRRRRQVFDVSVAWQTWKSCGGGGGNEGREIV